MNRVAILNPRLRELDLNSAWPGTAYKAINNLVKRSAASLQVSSCRYEGNVNVQGTDQKKLDMLHPPLTFSRALRCLHRRIGVLATGRKMICRSDPDPTPYLRDVIIEEGGEVCFVHYCG
jgi:hypothetical protein